MDLLSGIIILVLFVVLVLSIEKIDEKRRRRRIQTISSEFKELQKQYNELIVRLNCENKKKITDR